MALQIGNQEATEGMAKVIYESIRDVVKPPDDATSQIKKLSYAIAKGVIEHIQSNAEITGVEITIDSQVYTQTNNGKVG